MSADDIILSLIGEMDEENDVPTLGDAESLTLNDWPLKRIQFSNESGEYVAYVTDFEQGREYFGIVAVGAVDQFEALDRLTRAIIETMEYTPHFQP